MALQPCFECGASVSTLAPACPRCGAPEPTRAVPPVAPPAPRAEPDPEPAVSPGRPPQTTGHPAIWLYLEGDRRHGPHTRTEMLALLQRGAISAETRVKDDAMQFWLPLRAVPALAAGAAAVPAPAPAGPRPRAVQPPRAVVPEDERRIRSGKTVAAVVYALQAASFLVGITLLAGVVVNYVQRDEVRRTWVESHFEWQLGTFWGLVCWWVGALVLGLLFGFSVAVFVVAYLPSIPWMLYRIVRGWLRLNDGERI